MNPKKIIARHRRTAEEWVSTPRFDRRAENMKILRKRCSSDDARAAAVGSVCLTDLAIWYARRGLTSVLAGDPKGWEDLMLVLRYWACGVEVDPGGVPGNAGDISRTLLHALAFGERDLARRLAKILLLAQDDPRNLGGWDITPLPRYSARLWGLSEGQDIVLHRDDCAASPLLDRVLEVWHDAEALTAAVASVCDWHLTQSLQSTPGYPAFETPPYELLAVEVIALARVRERLGLPLVLPQHPLLELPLAHPPREFRFVSDEALELVRACSARNPIPEAARYRDSDGTA